MSGYTKLFHSIVTSTIWQEDANTKVLWVTLLALADKNGEVQASVPGLARIAGIPLEATESALKKFQEPDHYSRSEVAEGRRIAVIPGGWELINHSKYRKMANLEDQKEKAAERQRRFRERHAIVTHSNDGVTKSNDIAEAEAEAEAEANRFKQLLSPKSATPSAGADMKALETEFLAAWNDLPPPFSKIAEWNAKRKTAFKARIGEPYFKANWRAALDRMKASVFCRGGGPTGWVATVEFFLRPGAVAKILEGTYDGNGKRPVQKTERKLTDEDYRQQEIIIAENRKNAERDRLQRERDIAAGLIIPSQPKPNGSQAGDKVAQGREVPDLPHVRELVLGIKSVSPVG